MRAGRVTVNGQVADRPGFKIRPGLDQVCVDGRPIRPPPKEYLILYKPRGVVCTAHDPQGRRTYADLLPSGRFPRLFYAGRLDADSEGLLLLTNDGELCARLIHPRFHVTKRYRVWTDRPLSSEWITRLQRGIRCDGELLSADRVVPVSRADQAPVYLIELHQGRKRQIRRMMAAAGVQVRRLVREAIGPIQLGHLRPGQWRHLRPREVAALRHDVGLTDSVE